MKKTLSAIVLTFALAAPLVAEPLTYPKTNKVEHSDTYFDVKVEDPYRWLEDDRSAETAAWVTEENKVTKAFLDRIPFREALKNRLRELMNYERVSAPFEEGGYRYFYKNDGLQNHAVLYRTPVNKPDADPEVFLDPNGFSADGTTGLRGISFTKDGSLAAYQITEGGSDWRKVIVIDTATKKPVGPTLEDVKFSGLSWRNNDGFFYSSYDNPNKASGSQLSSKTASHKLMWHKHGTPQSEDVLIFGGDDRPTRYIGGEVTEDQRYLVVTAAQNTSGNQVFIKDLQDPNGDFIMVTDDYDADCTVITNNGSTFYMSTDIDAPNYRVVSFTLDQPTRENWKDVIPETDNVLIASTGGGKLFGNYLVDAKSKVKQFDLNGKLEREISLPDIGTASGFYAKRGDKELYYSFTNYITPNTIFHYDIESGKSTLYRRPTVDFDPAAYQIKQQFYKSKDGTKVPMFIVHKKGLELDGNNPTYLYGYGGFNNSLTPSFSPSRIAWLEQGGVYVVANLRGGGEYGERWHEAGTRLNKQNVFDDFISAAEYLIENKYTSPQRLAIAGGSNGGLLVGATMTQRPELARVALPAVGVLDMLRYHTFTAGAGWAADYGTAEESKEMFEYLYAYSPYHALKPGVDYPATLVTTADHDDRVVPAHSFKFAARLQEYHKGETPVLIRIQTKAGHGVVSTEQQIELDADVYAFTWANMGFTPKL
jgi:prolyl oligopeptidase